jgi:hypothetical protein
MIGDSNFSKYLIDYNVPELRGDSTILKLVGDFSVPWSINDSNVLWFVANFGFVPILVKCYNQISIFIMNFW